MDLNIYEKYLETVRGIFLKNHQTIKAVFYRFWLLDD